MNTQSITQIKDTYNALCVLAQHRGIEASRCKPVAGRFSDRKSATRRTAALQALCDAAQPVVVVQPVVVELPTKESQPGIYTVSRRGRPATFQAGVIYLGSVSLRSTTKRFASYRDGMTVTEYISEAGKNGRSLSLALGDVRYDAARGVIRVEPCHPSDA